LAKNASIFQSGRLLDQHRIEYLEKAFLVLVSDEPDTRDFAPLWIKEQDPGRAKKLEAFK
jgi:hypothetical protein